MSALEDVGRRGAYVQQGDLEEFESAIADYTGAPNCITVSNATDGLQLAMMASGLRQGGEVIISTHTMVATASAIHFAGGTPVPVDVGQDHLISADAVQSAITERTVAICPTQLNGRTCDMGLLLEVAARNNLDVYEDAAQGLGSKFRGKSAGAWGKAGCLSFYPSKILGTLGDGGAILTADEEVAETLRLLRDHGRIDRGDTAIWGFNSRMDNLSAAFLNVQFKVFGETIARRRAIARRYDEILSSIPGIVPPPSPDADPDHFDTFQNYEIECSYRDQLQAGLARMGVGTMQQWGGWPVHRFSKLGFNQHLPQADALFARMLMLPINMALTDEDVEFVCSAVVDVAGAVAG